MLVLKLSILAQTDMVDIRTRYLALGLFQHLVPFWGRGPELVVFRPPGFFQRVFFLGAEFGGRVAGVAVEGWEDAFFPVFSPFGDEALEFWADGSLGMDVVALLEGREEVRCPVHRGRTDEFGSSIVVCV